MGYIIYSHKFREVVKIKSKIVNFTSNKESGTVEDPVTGTASRVMGVYYMSYIEHSDQTEILIEQGNEIGRKGMIRVYAEKKNSLINVNISGKAVYMRDISIEY